MTSFTRWALTSRLTFWSVAVDEWGQRTYTHALELAGTYQDGGRLQRDDSGEEFVPAGTFLYELAPAAPVAPAVGWLVAVGTYPPADPPPPVARPIRRVAGADVTMHGETVPDWLAYTE